MASSAPPAMQTASAPKPVPVATVPAMSSSTPNPPASASSSSGPGPTPSASSSGGSVTPGDKPAPKPSAGCGKASPQVGSSGSPLMVSGHQYYVKLPTGYDANTPYKTVIMFNPTGNPIDWAEKNAGFEAVAKDAIRVYPHPSNSSNGWGQGDEAFFAPLFEKVTGDYCMDLARVFAGGESSGGEFVGWIGCEHADKVRAVAPGAPKALPGSALDASTRKCTGQVSAIVINSPKDNVLMPPQGDQMLAFYRDLNHCTSMSTPVTGFTDKLSNCVEYQGCDAGFPVFQCHHEDPTYSSTYHGWAAFAAKMIWAQWSTY
jgi:polyhydroxybutyrate depolymerase